MMGEVSRYWPDMDHPSMELEGGLEVTYSEHTYSGTYINR